MTKTEQPSGREPPVLTQAEGEELFRSIFERSGVGIALADADGRLRCVNPSFATMLGYTVVELQQKTFLDVTHADDITRTRDMIRQTGALPAPHTYEKRYIRKDGEIVWARATITRLRRPDGTMGGYLGMIEDITSRRRAVEALDGRRELLQAVMDNLPVMVLMFGADGRPLFVNREWERVFGWTLEEARSIDFFAAVCPELDDAAQARQTVREGSIGWTDFDARGRDGRIIPAAWACVKLSDGTSVTIGQDMSERRRMQRRLVQSEKMEALGQLAGGVAHDFNNLLTIVTSYATFVQDALGENTSAATDLNEIIAAADRAAALTRQLLTFSRREIHQPEVVNVNAVIEGVMVMLRRLIGEHIELVLLAEAAHPTVEADVHQLEQVVLNLVVNARDAIRDSGVITIETKNMPPGADEPRFVVLSVTDDGCGIEPEIRDRIFDPLFTTKPVGGGTGLGLATVANVLEQCNGRVELETEVGKGTKFHIFLPAVRAPAQSVEIPAENADRLRGSETILLVEDEAAVRRAASRILSRLGYNVLEARHGADGIRVSASHAGRIDLLVTDVVMPEVGGRELASRIRRDRPGTPVLYISGYTEDELLRKGVLESGAQLLRKPFARAELAVAVRELLSDATARGPGDCGVINRRGARPAHAAQCA